jgi:formiminotetrahydrofolate cyclodeaminase
MRRAGPLGYFKKKEIYEDKPINKYIEELSSKSPVPGGGSVAALMGALAAGLVAKVANFTVGKDDYADVEEEITHILDRSTALADYFKSLASEDAVAYGKLSEAFKSPRDEGRPERIQKALLEAIEVPLQVCKRAHAAIKLCLPLAQKGNRNLITDVGIASFMFKCAFQSGLLNVEINLKSIKDPQFILKMAKTLKPLEEDINSINEEVITEVESYLAK